MAHRGKHYPVLIRRDFNFNSDISIANPLPARWRVVVHSGVTPTYPIDGAIFVCVPNGFVPPDQYTWLSPKQVISGLHYFVRVLHNFPALPDTIRRGTFQLETDEHSLVAAWANRNDSRRDPFAFISTEANTFFLDHGLFTHGGQFHASSTDPVGY